MTSEPALVLNDGCFAIEHNPGGATAASPWRAIEWLHDAAPPIGRLVYWFGTEEEARAHVDRSRGSHDSEYHPERHDEGGNQ